MPNTDVYTKARKRAEAKYRFLVHGAVYAAVMILLVFINVLTLPGPIWFIWPMIGWGFAVVLHGMSLYLSADKNAVLDALTERELRKTAAHKPD
ncbi:2TM domain-containing protein [Aliiruegeria sabulilitoris]|uniref:2TM domain-containing protein n=1 Tax=Aliiruegeria sabulilitoris TaxID=1510458 RepID=UPI0008297556|nr:2TM domain-containing protein [Aliiruegeria sabulilitoris]NDR58668.1 2TM domain-containing protein [Pseudoruegeria sp. M32A2M]